MNAIYGYAAEEQDVDDMLDEFATAAETYRDYAIGCDHCDPSPAAHHRANDEYWAIKNKLADKLMPMSIGVNNGDEILIKRDAHGVTVTSVSSKGEIERQDKFSEAQIVAVLNLLRYLRDNGLDHVYVSNHYTPKGLLREAVRNGELEEFVV